MELNIEECVDSILQARKGHESTWHIWLNGFHQIINNSILEFSKIENYLEPKLAEHPPFTRFRSGAQLLRLAAAYSKGFDFKLPIPLHKIGFEEINKSRSFPTVPDLLYVHLPISDFYHLEFPLTKENDECRFVYTSCPDCEILEEHGFPEIALRQSVNFNEDEEVQESIRKGTFLYDNRISVDHQDRETIIESYEAFKDFIEATKVN